MVFSSLKSYAYKQKCIGALFGRPMQFIYHIIFFKSYTIGNHIGTTVLKIRTEQIPQVKPKIIPAITSVR